MKVLLIMAALFLFSGCTYRLPMYNVANDVGTACPQGDEQCMIDLIDSISATGGCDIWSWMEGYYPASLREMYSDGLLTFDTMSILWVPTGLLGYVYVEKGKYGDMYKCEVNYVEDGQNNALASELMKCTGCLESIPWPYFGYDSLAPEQKRIMKLEGKDKWTDTEFYKSIIWEDRYK